MKKMKNFLLFMFFIVSIFSIYSCDNKEDTEFNLPGTWYTEQEIDYGSYTLGRGTVMTFNANNEGTIGTTASGDYIVFEWRWINYGYNTMELMFRDGSTAYIEGAIAEDYNFSGTWYNSWIDFQNKTQGQPFYMRREQ